MLAIYKSIKTFFNITGFAVLLVIKMFFYCHLFYSVAYLACLPPTMFIHTGVNLSAGDISCWLWLTQSEKRRGHNGMIVTYSEKLSIRFLLGPTKSDSFLRKDVSRPQKEKEEGTRKATSLISWQHQKEICTKFSTIIRV